ADGGRSRRRRQPCAPRTRPNAQSAAGVCSPTQRGRRHSSHTPINLSRCCRFRLQASIPPPPRRCAAAATILSGRRQLPPTDQFSTWQPRVLSILRIVTGLLMLQHGLNKLFDFPPTPTHVPWPAHAVSLAPGLAGLLEAIGGVLLVLGLFTR